MGNVTTMMRNFRNPPVSQSETSDEHLNRLVADIYDAALEPMRWSEVLGRAVDFVGGTAGGIISNHPAGDFTEGYYRVGMDCKFAQLYAETYWRLDPVAKLSTHELEEVVSIPDLIPYDEFRRGRFFREWARPQGWIDAANALLDRSADHHIYFSVIRGEAEGMVDRETRQRMRFVVPHIRRALRIQRDIGRKEAEAAAFLTTLDALAGALFFLDAGSRIVHANAAGRELIDKGEVLRLVDGRLVARDVDAERQLRQTLAASPDAAFEDTGCALALRSSAGDHYVARRLPLAAAHRAVVWDTAVAALFIHRAKLEAPFPAQVIGQIYGLTPAELRVLLSIVDLGGISEVASALGIAVTTVKTHLRRIFEKTETRRQADLIRLVAGFSGPLAT